jgi:hypothetical protein
MEECLPSKHNFLSSISRTAKKQKKKRERKKEKETKALIKQINL